MIRDMKSLFARGLGSTSARLALVAGTVALGAAGQSLASIAVTNENNGDTGTILFVVGPDVYRATSFTTGATAETIGSVDLRVANRAGLGSTEQYTAAIYGDGGGIPGGLVGSFAPVDFTQTVFNQFQPVSFTTPGINVNAGTTYWLVVGATMSAAGGDWLGTTLPNETSSIGWTIGDAAYVFAAPPGPGWIPIGTAGRFTINLIPAPGAAALLGLGGLVAARRRRAK